MSLKEEIIKRLRSTEREGIEDLIKYMEEYDYFTAPASTKYHSNFEGGLALHSHNVVNLLLRKKELFKLDVTDAECIIAGYLHDLCKMNMYVKNLKIAKDAKTQSKWVGIKSYGIEEALPIGHAEKSLLIASRFIKLTPNEIMMIRWHMGLPEDNGGKRAMEKCVEFQRAVAAIVTADYEASMILENIVDSVEVPVEEYNEFRVREAARLENEKITEHKYKIDLHN